MKTEKEARRDAREFARSQMYYGEGAGTRRKLIRATVDAKAHKDPAYARAFHHELASQDMAEHAAKARQERRRRDVSHTVGKNIRGIASGNHQGVNAGIVTVLAVVTIAHKTGLDVKVQQKYRELKTRYNDRKKFKPTIIK